MKTLQTRLTRLYTLTTGAILLLVMAVFLTFSIGDTKSTQLKQFQLIWNILNSRFLSSNALSHSFLAQTEADYQMVIHIRENGIPFLYQGAWYPDTDRGILLNLVQTQIQEEGVFLDKPPVSSTVSTSSLITIEGEHGDHYYAMATVVSTKNGVKSLCAIALIPPLFQTMKETILLLCFLSVLSISCLWFISWKFVGWSLKPVEESQKKQARFIAAASHELRSPLTVLRSAISALSSDLQEKDTLLPLIDSECVRMSRLIDDMLFLASADGKTWNVQWEEIDMDTLLIDLFESFRPVCQEKGIHLHLELPDEPLPILTGDPARIRQLLIILLDNAQTYTPSGKSIYILTRPQCGKKQLILQVIDEGCGIPPESRPYIFDRFYQADHARSDKHHFGLGLSIAKELVQLHKGTIQLSDPDPSFGSYTGACFTVILPLSPTADDKSPAPAS